MRAAETTNATSLGQRTRRRVTKTWKKSRPEILYTYALPTASAQTEAGSSGYELVEADADMLERLRTTYPRQLSEHKCRLLTARLTSAGEACWIMVDPDGTLAGYCHAAFGSTVNERINHPVEVKPSQAYFFDDYVFKKYRGMGFHSFSIAKRLEIAADRGVSEAITTITRSNAPSIASYRKFGATRTSTLVYLPWLKKTLQMRGRHAG